MTSNNTEFMRVRKIVEGCLQSMLPPGQLSLDDAADWIESGMVDSMGHVEVLLCIETALGLPDLFGRLGEAPPTTTRAAVELILGAISEGAKVQSEEETRTRASSA